VSGYEEGKKMKFIRLSTVLINPSMINTIRIEPLKYNIAMNTSDIQGHILFGSGSVYSQEITISQSQQPEDYAILSQWMDQHAPLPHK
jgi:hypothetical protein